MRTSMLTAILIISLTGTPGAQSPDAKPENYYGAGNRVDIVTPMPADVIAAGRDVTIRQSVAGDIMAAAWRMEITADANDDLRAAGMDIRVNAPVRGDVTVAGGTVTFGPQATVGGRAWLTGETVRIDGVIDREVSIAAAHVIVAGEFRKPARIIAEKLEIEKTARLSSLAYSGPVEAVIANGATITGPVAFTQIERRDARPKPAVSTFLFTTHLFLAGLLVIAFLPRTEASIVDTLRRRPGKSVIAGFLLLLSVPIAALFLIVSGIGLPFGLMLAAIYASLLFAGVLTTAFFVGEWEGRLFTAAATPTRSNQVLMMLAGVVTLALLRSLVGEVVVFISLLFGFGALTVWLYQSAMRVSHAPAA